MPRFPLAATSGAESGQESLQSNAMKIGCPSPSIGTSGENSWMRSRGKTHQTVIAIVDRQLDQAKEPA